MHSLGDPDILALDEACAGRSGIEAALAMLDRISPASVDVAALPLGERDRLLLKLRAATLGERMDAQATCPACGVVLEVPIPLADILMAPSAVDEDDDIARLTVGGRTVALRRIDSRDLAAAAAAASAGEGRRILAARALVPPEEAVRVDPASLGDDDVDEIGRRLARLDAAADITFALHCPDCGREWEAGLDVPGLIRNDLHRRAQRLLDEVDAIARVYHWCEADILALSPVRRRDYLARIGQ